MINTNDVLKGFADVNMFRNLEALGKPFAELERLGRPFADLERISGFHRELEGPFAMAKALRSLTPYFASTHLFDAVEDAIGASRIFKEVTAAARIFDQSAAFSSQDAIGRFVHAVDPISIGSLSAAMGPKYDLLTQLAGMGGIGGILADRHAPFLAAFAHLAATSATEVHRPAGVLLAHEDSRLFGSIAWTEFESVEESPPSIPPFAAISPVNLAPPAARRLHIDITIRCMICRNHLLSGKEDLAVVTDEEVKVDVEVFPICSKCCDDPVRLAQGLKKLLASTKPKLRLVEGPEGMSDGRPRGVVRLVTSTSTDLGKR